MNFTVLPPAGEQLGMAKGIFTEGPVAANWWQGSRRYLVVDRGPRGPRLAFLNPDLVGQFTFHTSERPDLERTIKIPKGAG